MSLVFFLQQYSVPESLDHGACTDVKIEIIIYILYDISFITLKPIFHCDAKYLASGVGVGQCTRRQNFATQNIPTCWYILR